MIPNILSIEGSDPSGGAGIQADIKAISACGGYVMAAITALTTKNTCGFSGAQMVEPEFGAAQIKPLRDDILINAVKIGILGTPLAITAVTKALRGLDALILLDSVMEAKSGDRLLAAEAVAALREILPLATIITPNLPEAADLLGLPEATSWAELDAQARAVLALAPSAMLFKGGHLLGDDCPDLLADGASMTWLPGARHAPRKTHGPIHHFHALKGTT